MVDTHDKMPQQPKVGEVSPKKARGLIGKLLLVDSVSRNLKRSQTYLAIYGTNTKKMATWIGRSFNSQPSEAKTIEEIKNTAIVAASGMVASFFVTLVFACISLWQLTNGNGVASAIVAVVTLTYGFRFFVALVIWARAKQVLVNEGAW